MSVKKDGRHGASITRAPVSQVQRTRVTGIEAPIGPLGGKLRSREYKGREPTKRVACVQ